MPRDPRPLEVRFWDRVRKADGCWLWTGSTSTGQPGGYGKIQEARRAMFAHRLSWQLHYGPIPAGMHILHRCDNPPCVRPDHLELGTHAKNMHDAWERGRRRRRVAA